MRVFAVSDLHVDYESNARWIAGLSGSEYADDVLIVAGDVTDSLALLEWTLNTLATRFRKVLCVPGNHDLWVIRDGAGETSLQKFGKFAAVVERSGASMEPFHHAGLSIVPLHGWYDYSFGQPSHELLKMWADYRACRWPAGLQPADIAEKFVAMNEVVLGLRNEMVITFSHYLPRIDVMPTYIPPSRRNLYPVLGTSRLDQQIRQLHSRLHVYGHSHVNRKVHIDGVTYLNNAFGYPQETQITLKELVCIHQT